MKKKPKKKDPKQDPENKEETFLDKLSKIQHLLGFGLLALVALIAAGIFSLVSTSK